MSGRMPGDFRDLLMWQPLLQPQQQHLAAGGVQLRQGGFYHSQLLGVFVFFGVNAGHRTVRRRLGGGLVVQPQPPLLASQDVERLVARGHEEPVAQMPADRHGLLSRERNERLLDGVLRKRVVAQESGGEAQQRFFVFREYCFQFGQG